MYIFRSEAELLGSIEPWYPAGIDHCAFDREGRALELFADPPVVERKLIGLLGTDNAHESTLFIRPLEDEPGHAAELESRLREWLASQPVSPRRRWWRKGERSSTRLPAENIGEMKLPALLERAVEREGFTH